MDRIERRATRAVRVGPLTLGAGAPVVIQSMTNTDPSDPSATLDQVLELAEAGCEMVRLAVPDERAAAVFEKVAGASPVPLVADIHFKLRLAFIALEGGAAKVRINPGNISRDGLSELARKAGQCGAAIRVGVNAGSLERRLLRKHGEAGSAALVESALGHLQVFEECGFKDIVVSLKASSVYTVIAAYRLFSGRSNYPLHLGVTGAGPLESGLIKGAVGIGALLSEGIGDTVRVSLTASPVEEVKAAKKIIQSLGLRTFGPELISCPTCGRCEVDLLSLVREVEAILAGYPLPLKVAVMGCAVNGPGEAREADLGISAGRCRGILFRRGEVIRTVDNEGLLDALKAELDRLRAEPDRPQ